MDPGVMFIADHPPKTLKSIFEAAQPGWYGEFPGFHVKQIFNIFTKMAL